MSCDVSRFSRSAQHREPGETSRHIQSLFEICSRLIQTVPMVGELEGKRKRKGTKDRVTTARSRSCCSFFFF